MHVFLLATLKNACYRVYVGTKPDLYKRYMDDVASAASCSGEDLREFLEFASSFHPNLEYTWSISTDKLPFLDIYLKPRDNHVSTSIYYKGHGQPLLPQLQLISSI